MKLRLCFKVVQCTIQMGGGIHRVRHGFRVWGDGSPGGVGSR
jgi:hypothetical protein